MKSTFIPPTLLTASLMVNAQTLSIDIQVFGVGDDCAVETKPVRCDQLVAYLRDTVKASSDSEILIRGDASPNASSVGRVNGLLRNAGFKKTVAVGFITVPPDK